MSRRLSVALLACAALVHLPFPASHAADLPRGDARAAGFAPERLARVRQLLQEAVDRKQIAGGSALIARHGKVVEVVNVGQADAEAGRAVDYATLFRIASMTKPVTSAAVLMLHDEGKLRLSDPVSKYVPEFKDPTVLAIPKGSETPANPPYPTVKAAREITIHDLLTHTSGLTYVFLDRPVLGRHYAEAHVSDGLVETPGTIGDNVKRLAKLPLLNQPGTAWEYGLSIDVLGRVVEVASGRSFDAFLADRIFAPLKMDDTSFLVPKAKRDRLAAVYAPVEGGTIRRVGDAPVKAGALVYSATYPIWDESRYFSGGAGLVSTIGDYARFLQMFLNRGELDGARLLRPETVALMTRDQIGPLTIAFPNHGDGFGYGFGVLTERGRSADVAGVGSYSWGGFFNTYFWVDPGRELIGILMTQIFPSDHLKLRERFKALTYEALAH